MQSLWAERSNKTSHGADVQIANHIITPKRSVFRVYFFPNLRLQGQFDVPMRCATLIILTHENVLKRHRLSMRRVV